jgi:general secretion pathway protein I
MHRRGFTLLEMMVATLVMGIAVVGLLSSISQSLANASRLTERDRAAVLARSKMDELLLDQRLANGADVEGRFDPAITGGAEAGWRARMSRFEALPQSGPGMPALDRVELEVWWKSGPVRRAITLEGFRRDIIGPNGE